MIKIGLLKDQPEKLSQLAQIWHKELASIWAPEFSIAQAKERFTTHLNDSEMPLTLVAIIDDQAVGMCSLRQNDGIRPDLCPWLGALVVDSDYQRQGIGRLLIEAAKEKARGMGYTELFLFCFDPTIPAYYERLGWKKIAMDHCRNLPVTVMEICLK